MAKRKGKLITLTPAELAHIDRAARARGLTAAAFIRSAAIAYAGPMEVARASSTSSTSPQLQLPTERR